MILFGKLITDERKTVVQWIEAERLGLADGFECESKRTTEPQIVNRRQIGTN